MKQLLLPPGIPWYRTRLFWGIIIGILIAWGLFTFFYFYNSGGGLWGLFDSISLSLGSVLFGLIGFMFYSTIGSKFFSFLYLAILLFLTHKTFIKPRVSLKYPIILVLLFIFGNLFGILYSFSFVGF